MRRVLVRAAAAAALGAATLAPAPASAVSSFTVYGEAHIGCFGCGPTIGAADLWVTGVYDNQPVAATYPVDPPNGSAHFVGNTPAGPSCLLSGTAEGTVTVGLSTATFTWVRVGGTALIAIPGVARAAVQVWVAEPVGNPCGGPVRLVFSGGGGG